MARFVGIDLAGKPSRPTGWALLDGRALSVKTLFSDDEILYETAKADPSVVAIDAPLNLPKSGATRFVDREMRKRGYPVLPPLYPCMRELTLRGMAIANKLRHLGLRTIEIHPASTLRALSMPRNRNAAWHSLSEMGFWIEGTPTDHEVDAAIAALTALLYHLGLAEVIGDEEGLIVVPIRRKWSEISIF